MIDGNDTARLATTLEKLGIVTVAGYVDEQTCDELRAEIDGRLDSGELRTPEEEMGYNELAEMGEPVANHRGGMDEGMIDVFNMDLAVPELADIKNDPDLKWIISEAMGETYEPDNVNVYVNRSVTETRGYHADTYFGKVKSFLYLTDVPDESYGPFSYVPGSHRSRLKRVASVATNRIQGNDPNDAVFVDESDAIHCTASKGTLILANQGGYHRGIPQHPNRERMLVTTSYTPVEPKYSIAERLAQPFAK